MLTRRGFAGFATCAICGITEFVAAEVSAQGTQPQLTPGVTRKILSQTEGPTAGYVTLLVEATLEPGVPVARHTPSWRRMYASAESSAPIRCGTPMTNGCKQIAMTRPDCVPSR